MNERNKSRLFLEIVRREIEKYKENNSKISENTVHLYENEEINVSDLSKKIKKTSEEIVKYFWDKNKIINKNQSIPKEWIVDYMKEKNIDLVIKKKEEINFKNAIEEYLNYEKEIEYFERPLIVAIMGHIDHGKTTLLNTIKGKSEKEIGDITQNINLSKVKTEGNEIIFLDTPGHSEFIKMREKGISLADLVVLVIDNRDGIMIQTEEIIKFIKKYEIPCIVFINEKYKNRIDINLIKGELQKNNLVPIDWEGDTIVISGDAREIEDANNLIKNISIFFPNKKTNIKNSANGVIVDSYYSSKINSKMVILIILGGVIKEKDIIFVNGTFIELKIILDFKGNKIEKAYPGDIIKIIANKSDVHLGNRFLVLKKENKEIEEINKELESYLKDRKRKQLNFAENKEIKNINLFLVSDKQNSLETLESLIMRKNNSEVNLSIIGSKLGGLINDNLNIINIRKCVIIYYNLKASKEENSFFKTNELLFFENEIIYELEKELEELVKNKSIKKEYKEEIKGEARVKMLFNFSRKVIAGCIVSYGEIKRRYNVKIIRNGEEVFKGGKIESLKIREMQVNEVAKNKEFGIILSNFSNFLEKDELIFYEKNEKII